MQSVFPDCVRVTLGTLSIAFALAVSACGPESGPGPLGVGNSGPWVGSWVQVNFLAIDDGGVWDADDLNGIGFVATVTETEWTLTDEFGGGCSVTFTYSVGGNNRYRKQPQTTGPLCPPGFSVDLLPDETGRLEFSNGNSFMIDHFDLLPGDEIVAFKWVRR